MKKLQINGEERILAMPSAMWQKGKAATAAKADSDNAELTSSASNEQENMEAARSPRPQAIRWYDAPVGIVPAKMFWDAGIDLCDQSGSHINKGTKNVYVYTTPDGQYDKFYSVNELENVIDLTNLIPDVATWCATVYEVSKGRMNETQSFFLKAYMNDDKAMQKVLWWKSLMGCSLKAAKDFTGYKKPVVKRTDKKGKVKTSTRGVQKALENTPELVTPASVDDRLATDDFAEYVMAKQSGKVTLRHLTRKDAIKEIKKEYLSQLKDGQKGGVGTDAPSDTAGGQ